MSNREYYAVSIKHSEHGWKFGMPLYLWGSRTKDEEKRSYAGYTRNPNEAELYSLEEFCEKYPERIYPWMLNKPVKIEIGFCKKYRKFDTVLVDKGYVDTYYKTCGLYSYAEPDEESEATKWG